jgi:hypothetical protein
VLVNGPEKRSALMIPIECKAALMPPGAQVVHFGRLHSLSGCAAQDPSSVYGRALLITRRRVKLRQGLGLREVAS